MDIRTVEGCGFYILFVAIFCFLLMIAFIARREIALHEAKNRMELLRAAVKETVDTETLTKINAAWQAKISSQSNTVNKEKDPFSDSLLED